MAGNTISSHPGCAACFESGCKGDCATSMHMAWCRGVVCLPLSERVSGGVFLAIICVRLVCMFLVDHLYHAYVP